MHSRFSARALACAGLTLAATAQAIDPSPTGGPQFVVGPVCPGLSTTTASFAGATGPIDNVSYIHFTTSVAGQGSYLWDVNVRTSLLHQASTDLDVKLISPAGTLVRISTDNGGQNDDVFNGTLWDDNVNDPATDHVYANFVTATPLSPEGRLAGFRGENPNGTWTLRIEDDAFGQTGSLTSWTLELSSLSFAPSETTTNFTRSPNLALTDNGTVSDVLNVSGLASYLMKAVLYVELPHNFPDDLEVKLTSPAGTQVKVTTDNGGGFVNVFNGTNFDPDAPMPVSDNLYTNMVVAPLLSPEGSFDNFLGQNPNGNWTLAVTDDAAGNLGTLVRWDLKLTTTTNPNAPAPTSFAGSGGAIPDFGTPPTTTFTANVSGLGGVLWDVDLITNIAHGACADLDVTLISPAGSAVAITTDNGFASQVFAGTRFDDNVNDPATDYFYTSSVVATPLSPEGRLSAFRGQNPNGVWTLSISDDTPTIAGSLNGWTLDLATIASLPSTASAVFSRTPNVPVPDNATVVDTLNASGMGTQLNRVVLYAEIQHSWSSDLDVSLTSPAGTIVIVSTDNGGGADDVFLGTLWDPSATGATSDHPYLDFVTATPLAPEGSFDNFLGQDPNGTWSLTVTDDFMSDTGTLVRWDLTLSTCTTSAPVSYCPPIAPGTSNGCLPSIGATANPNVSHSNSCVITVSNVEGQRFGILFYGVNGAQNTTWCTMGGGNSFQCVKAPVQRTGAQNSGGTAGQCNGALALDWNVYQVNHPGSLGSPWIIGEKANVQGWFRDPPSCRTTFLSQALELTYQP